MVEHDAEVADRLRHRLGEVGKAAGEQLSAVEWRAPALAPAMEGHREQQNVPAVTEERVERKQRRVDRRLRGTHPVNHDQRGTRAVLVAPMLSARSGVVGGVAEVSSQLRVQRLKRAVEPQHLDAAASLLKSVTRAGVDRNWRRWGCEDRVRVLARRQRRVVIKAADLGAAINRQTLRGHRPGHCR